MDKHSMKRAVAVVVIAVSLGCAHTRFERTGSNPPPALPPGPCSALVFEEAPADRRYVQIGFCTISKPGDAPFMENNPDMIRELKRCACENGGNAILLKSGTDVSSSQPVRGRAAVLVVFPKE